MKKKEELFLKHYFRKYHLPEYPPSWIIIECLSFGSIRLLFKNIKKMNDKSKICKIFGVRPTTIESWTNSLRYTRNICAHHARLWNRWFVFRPWLPVEFNSIENRLERTFSEQVIIIIRLLKYISPNFSWREKLIKLLDKYPDIPKQHMGFTKNCQNDNIWKLI